MLRLRPRDTGWGIQVSALLQTSRDLQGVSWVEMPGIWAMGACLLLSGPGMLLGTASQRPGTSRRVSGPPSPPSED